MHSYGEILKIPALRRLMAASVPADIADWLDYIAIMAMIIFTWNEGPFALAWLLVALSLPALLVGPFTAVFVDRSDLRWALVVTNLGRALTTLALIFAPNIFWLLPIVFLRGVVDSAFTPARQAALQALTPEALNAPANGMLFAINQTTKIVGPAVGGILLAASSPQLVFALNSGLSVLAAAILLFIRLPARPPVERHSIWKEAPEGFQEFVRNEKLRFVLFFLVAVWASAFLYDALLGILVKQFGFAEDAYGYVVAAAGLGGILGSLLAGIAPMKRELPWMGAAALFASPLTILVGVWALTGVTPPAWLYLLITLCKGAAVGFMLVPYRATIQREAPPEKVARVFAAAEAVTILVVVTSPFLGGAIAALWGVGAAFLAGGLGLLLIGIVTLAFGLRRQSFGDGQGG